MKRKIGAVIFERKYLERLQTMWNKNYADEIELYGSGSMDELKSMVDIQKLDLVLVDENCSLDELIKDRSIIYLTEMSQNKEKKGEVTLYKYQQVSRIYQYVKEWIMKKDREDFSVQGLSKDSLIYRYGDKNKINQVDLEILKNIDIDLVPILQVDEERLQYSLRELVTLEEICMDKISEKDAWDMIGQICTLLVELEDYLLDPHHVSLQINHIFYHKKSGKIKLIYIPIAQEVDETQMLSELEKVIQKILHNVCESSTIQAGGQITNNPQTVVFSNLQAAAEQSKRRIASKVQGETTLLIEEEKYPYLIRKSTGEKIWIKSNLFKIGKDIKMVDYCIGDNPAISKNHADIKTQNGIFYVVDHHSLNATMLNGKKIPPEKWMQLQDEDCLILANEKFDFYKNGYKERK